MECIKSLQAPNFKTIALTKVMYTAICRSDEHAFNNMSEESEKKTLSSRNRCGLFQVKAWLSRPKNMAFSDPSKRLKTPDSELAEDRLLKDIIK